MESKEYIILQIKQLGNSFNRITIRYEKRVCTNSHIIEITPFEVYEENEEYLYAESLIESEFEKLFINENIVFISDRSLTEIYKADFELGTDRS